MNSPSKIGCGTVLFFVLAYLFIQFAGDLHDARQKHSQPGTLQSTEPTPKTKLTPEQLGLKWQYRESPDEMGRGIVKQALVGSLNTVEFDFPYQGVQCAFLHLRIHPRHGKDVMLSINKGQFLCNPRCQIAVRFDQSKAQNFTAIGSASHSTTMLFIRDYDRFLTSLRKSKKVYIEVQFYQQGFRVFEFDVSDLKW